MHDVSLTDALTACRAHRLRTETEWVPVAECGGRILAEDLRARCALPQTDVAGEDGVALRAAETPGWLRVVGEHLAGRPGNAFVGEGEAVRVSTGAPMPPGADAVVALPDIAFLGELVEVPVEAERGRFVRRAGEVIMQGVLMLPAGMQLPATALTAIGSVGHATAPVRRRPRVAVVSIGASLVPLGEPLERGAVHDAARVGVTAQVTAADAAVVFGRAVGDDRGDVQAALGEALGLAELVVTIGAVSAGTRDHVRPVLAELGAEEVFHRVRLTPCASTTLSVRDGVPVLSLPGDPAAAVVAFHLFGRELLGCPATWDHRAPLGVAVHGEPGMVAAVRCAMRGGRLHPLAGQAAHAVTTMAMADAIALVDGDAHGGDLVPWTPVA